MSEPSHHAELARKLLHRLSEVSSPAVSPHGDKVAFVVTTLDVDDNTARSRIWLDDRPVTSGDHDANPTWSPDGRHLAFTSRRGEKKSEATIHVLPVDGPGETRELASMAGGAGDLCWSPDGRHLAFISRTRDKRYSEDDDSSRAPRKVETLFARLNGPNWTFDQPTHVYVVAADGTGEPRNLTPGSDQFANPCWLPDSSALLADSYSGHEDWDLAVHSNLFLVPLAGAGSATGDDGPVSAVRALTATSGDRYLPAVSPDGTRVAFLGNDDHRLFPHNDAVGVAPLQLDADQPVGDDTTTWVSSALDRSFVGTKGTRAPLWLDDNTLLATAEDRGSQHLYVLTADGSRPPEALTSGPVAVGSFDAALAGGDTPVIATTRTTVTAPAELHVNDERRTTVGAGVEDQALSWERFAVPTTDGSGEIDAWIMRPAGMEHDGSNETEKTGEQFPVLLNVHGGPFTQYGEYFFDEFQMQARAGFVVIAGNPRGSSGRHTAWGQAITGPNHPVQPGSGWGSVDVDDVVAILDTALERFPFCDPDRVGMLGGSYGGYMATTLAGRHGDRFRGICSERAVNNLESLEWSSDIAGMFATVHGATHLEDPEAYRSRSPIRNVADITVPMLIIHSEEDWRCPIGQAEELFVALRMMGREVDFYRFPGESHELSRSGSPVHRVQRAEIILDWFADKLSLSPPAKSGLT